MPNLNLNLISKPDLTDLTIYPDVVHDHTCEDVWHPVKSCVGALHRVRPYKLPTEQLAQLKFPWARRQLFQVPVVPLVPPSLGTLCPTIGVDTPTVSTGVSGTFDIHVDKVGGDACQPAIIPSIVFPCTQVLPGSKTVTMVPGGAAATWTQVVDNDSGPASCSSILNDILTIPCSSVGIGTVSNSLSGISGGLVLSAVGTGCNTVIHAALTLSVSGGGGGGGAGVSAGFYVGTSGSNTPDDADTCIPCYPPGAVVPVYDRHGLLGPSGTQLDPFVNTFINKSDNILTDGDPIFISLDAGSSTSWSVFA